MRQIFEWKAQDTGNSVICQRLESMGIPSTNKYKYLRGIVKKPKFAHAVWIPETVASLLRNTVYLGHVSQGKRKEALYAGTPLREIKREDWIIIKNTHAPIVPQDLFDAANKVMDERRGAYDAIYRKNDALRKDSGLLKGLLFCGDCNKALKRINRNIYSYECRIYKANKQCIKKSIGEKALYAAVYEAVKLQMQACVDITAVVDKLNRESGVRLTGFDTEIEEAEKELRRIAALRQTLFEDYAAKRLCASEYQLACEKYTRDAEKQQNRLAIASQGITPQNKRLATLNRVLNEKKLTAEMAQALIERINLYANHRIEVVLKFRDEYTLVFS